MTRSTRPIFACFFLSGATSLVYQVVWVRELGLVFGHSTYAITAVLAAFMAGLALGSALFARRAARLANPLRVYAGLEIGIGLYCACVPFLLAAGAGTYFGIQRALGLGYEELSLVQFGVVVLLLLLPTALMGGTLPVLSQALAAGAARPGRTVGALYAVNTTGAVVGVVLAGYVLLPIFGNHATTNLAAAANLAVGGLALVWSRRVDLRVPRAVAERAAGVEPRASLPVLLTLVALGASGAVSMAYEIAWTRALTLVIGSSTYAFTAVLTSFLVGIAGGSALYSRRARAREATPATFAALQAAIAVTVTLTLLVFERVPEFFLAGLGVSDAPGFVQSLQVVVSLVTLLASTLLIGATLPCAVAVATRRAADIGRHTGRAYAVNTMGAIGGILLTGFGLVPWYGVHAALKIGAATNLALAGALVVISAPRALWRGWAPAAGAVAGAAIILSVPVWDARVMVSGPAIYGKAYVAAGRSAPMAAILRVQEVLFYRDGLNGTVSVNRVGDSVILRVNGKADAATIGDTTTQLMLGHLPMLLHPDPRQVLVIGMGSGITAGAVARYPMMERLDIVEIEPAVLEASAYFTDANRHVLLDPRVHTTVADGRNFLFTAPRRYDVISSEPSNPWIGGLASLFSAEFFTAARSRLRPGGIMIQWIHGYSMRDADLRMVVNTFRSVFPATSVWNTSGGDYLLVGRAVTAPLDYRRLESSYKDVPGVAADMRGMDIMSWGGILGFFMLSDGDTERYAAGAGLNRDDRLPLEFSAPRAMYLDSDLANWRLMRLFQTAALPEMTAAGRGETNRVEVRYAIGMGYLARDVPGDALVHFTRALELDPLDVPSALGAGRSEFLLGHWSAALAHADGVLAREPGNSAALFVAAVATARMDRPGSALPLLERAVVLDPTNAEYAAALRALKAAIEPRQKAR